MVVLVSLFICLIPKIFTSIDPDADKSGGASGAGAILWPLCFMLGFVSKSVLFIHSGDFKLLSPPQASWPKLQRLFILFATYLPMRRKIVSRVTFDYAVIFGARFVDGGHFMREENGRLRLDIFIITSYSKAILHQSLVILPDSYW